MEAVPRLPMLSFDLRTSTENAQFGPSLKQYIASFYNEDPDSYNTEINNLETLRAGAVRPTVDVTGCQLLKKYYCQLHFLKSRFPMGDMQAAAVYFSWKDNYSNLTSGVGDINFELMCVLYNIGALHTQLGALDSRSSADGLKMACTHFQCAAWAFQHIKEAYHQMVPYISSIEVAHFMQQVCLAQAQECILEKSMMDNRKSTITAKVAVQVVDHYKRALVLCTISDDENSFSNLVGSRIAKEWFKYLSFKVAYHKCIALLFQGQQAEEQQKMGERVAFYQAACEQLEEVRKLSSGLKQQKEMNEAIAFTSDVVEGKRKAAKNENEFIYHEEVPDRRALQEVKGASLVKGIAFNVNDIEVSGPDIFARLVPMEAHEASSLYSEKKAQKLRQLGELVEARDQALAEFMSSLQLDIFNQMRRATGLSQDIVDRAAALSAKPMLVQELTAAMGKLSNSYSEVESMLTEMQELMKEEEKSEKDYQELMGKRPPSIIATDLSREAAKYKEAHNKANDSNLNLHKAMTTHVANLKILGQPLMELQKQIPAVDFPNPNIDENIVREIENLIAKVEEMRNQRAMLWSQLREAIHQDDITSVLVTRQPDQPLDQLFHQELQKHQELISLIEQNIVAQENILKAFVDAYARSTSTRRYLQEVINKRNSIVSGLVTSFDTHEDLLSKANKGIDFYNKLETNVAKLLQRIRSTCKVQQEEREQMLLKNSVNTAAAKEEVMPPVVNSAPKLKDYLDTRKRTTRSSQYHKDPQAWPPSIRPAPLGSEVDDPIVTQVQEQSVDRLSDRLAGLRTYTPNVDNSQINNNKLASTATTDMYQTISSITHFNQGGEINPSNYYADSQYSSYLANYAPPTSSSLGNYGQGYASNLPSSGNYGSTSTYSYPANQTTDQTYSYPTSQTSDQPYKYASYEGGIGVPPDQRVNSQSYSYPATYASSQMLPNVPDSTRVPSLDQRINQQSYNYSTTYASAQAQPSASGATYSGTSAVDQNVNQQSHHYNINYTTTQLQQGVSIMSYTTPTFASASYTVPSQSNYGSIPNGNYPTSYTPFEYGSSTAATTSYINPNYGLQSQPNYSFSNIPKDQMDYTSVTNYPKPIDGYDSSHCVTQANISAPSYIQMSSYGNVDQSASNAVASPAPTPSNYDPTQYYAPSGLGSHIPQDYGSGAAYTYYQHQNTVQKPNLPTQENKLPQTSSQTTLPVSTKESNIDLLTGLDFTIRQAPLVPQQKSSVPDVVPDAPKVAKVVQSKEEVLSLPKPEIIVNRKPLTNNEVKRMFEQEMEKFEKFVDVLPNKTLSGPTNLDLKWKEIQDKQEAEKKAISVARCYPMKNRYPDILPYDFSRVELKAAKDDYINASYIKDIAYYSAPFIVTQVPLQSTVSDFWTMIKEQQVELIVCLLGEAEIGGDIYWPTEKGRDLVTSGMVITLVSETVKSHWTERLISVGSTERRDSRILMHLQFTSWPGSLFPTSAEPVAAFITEIINLFLQQRNTSRPIVVHCSSGIGRSGLICLLVTAILEATNNAAGIPDLVALVIKLSGWRKNILRDREHLKFAYEVFLAYMKQVVAQGSGKRILSDVKGAHETLKTLTPEIKQSDDPLSSLDPFWASKRGT